MMHSEAKRLQDWMDVYDAHVREIQHAKELGEQLNKAENRTLILQAVGTSWLMEVPGELQQPLRDWLRERLSEKQAACEDQIANMPTPKFPKL